MEKGQTCDLIWAVAAVRFESTDTWGIQAAVIWRVCLHRHFTAATAPKRLMRYLLEIFGSWDPDNVPIVNLLLNEQLANDDPGDNRSGFLVDIESPGAM